MPSSCAALQWRHAAPAQRLSSGCLVAVQGNPYGDAMGAFGDNLFRYTLLNHAACEAPLVLGLGGFPYGQDVIFVANDWHAGALRYGRPSRHAH